VYWVYNKTYFEKDRIEKDFSRCPDIFGTDFPEAVRPYIAE
jgi:hypothetical protein